MGYFLNLSCLEVDTYYHSLYTYRHKEGKGKMENITHTTGSYYGDQTHNHIFTITDEQGTAAELYIEHTHLVIMNIEVREDRRGEGLARALYEHADEALGGIYHMPSWGRTEDGDAFADAMGGEDLDEEIAAEITGVDLEEIHGYAA